jgi:hypothetical protein
MLWLARFVGIALASAQAVPLPEQAAQGTAGLSGDHRRAVFCAANARFMLKHENRLGASDPASRQDLARFERWLAYATATANGSDVQQALVQGEARIAQMLQRRIAASDPVRDDPYSDTIVTGYKYCITSPPAAPDRLRRFTAFVRCSALARISTWALRGRNDPALAGRIEASNFLADAYIGSSLSTFVAPREDAEIAHDELVFKFETELTAMTPAAQAAYLDQLSAQLRECEKL